MKLSPLYIEFCVLKTELSDLIGTRIEQLSKDIRSELTSIKKETTAAISSIEITVNKHADQLTHLEQDSSTTMVKMEKEVERLNKLVDQITEKCTDLDNHSRRHNLRILHVKEGTESGKNMRDFAAKLLKDALTLEEVPLVDLAHRTLRTRQGDNEPPRVIIVRLYHIHEAMAILRKAAQMEQILFNGQKILIFPDYPAAVVKQRAQFKQVRALLRESPGVRFGLLYPARLRITTNGRRHHFTDPEKAMEFVRQNIKSGHTD